MRANSSRDNRSVDSQFGNEFAAELLINQALPDVKNAFLTGVCHFQTSF